MSSIRPILGHSKDQREVVLSPRPLTHPYLSGETMHQTAKDIFRGVFEPSDIISQLGRSANENKTLLRNSLIQYLHDSGIRYVKERSGNHQKKPRETLKPQLNDIVMFNDSEDKKRFRVIIEIADKNQVIMRSVLYGSVIQRKFHIRVLILLFRPSEWHHDIPLTIFH